MNFINRHYENSNFQAELRSSPQEGLNPPINLRITNQTTNSISLAWDAALSSISVSDYEIFRDGVRIAAVSPQTVTYVDTGLMPNTNYQYTVRATAVSEHSNQATGITLQEVATAPSVPTGLRSISVGTHSVSIAWDAATGNVSGYAIYRDGVRVTTTSTTATSFTNIGLQPDTNYYFQVRALGTGDTASALSDPLTIRTAVEVLEPNEGLEPPTNLRITNETTNSISLAWNASLGSVAPSGYEIFRNGAKIATVSPQTLTYTDTGLMPNTAYEYTVRATAVSAHSTPATGITTQASGGGDIGGGDTGGGDTGGGGNIIGGDNGASGSFNGLRPLPPAQAPAGARYVKVDQFWRPNPNTSPASASTRLSQYLSRTDFEQLFANRYGNGGWFAQHPNHQPRFDYYSYDNLQAAITRLANIVVIVQHRERRADAWRLLVLHKDNNPNNEALVVSEYEHWNEPWFANNGPIITEVADFGAFLGEPNRNDRLREIAAFLANVTQETSGGTTGTESRLTHGLWFIDELGYGAAYPDRFGYAQAHHPIWPAHANRSYHGRGPMQLSWNYNYGLFSDIFFKNANALLNDPSLVADNGILGWMTALAFWLLPQPPKPSCHDVMTTGWTPRPLDITRGRTHPGFGMTIMIINGGLEGDLTTDDPRIWTRVNMYQRIAGRNGADITGEKLDTKGMLAFP